MTTSQEEILKGLRTAMEAEIFGHNFYTNASQNTTDSLGRETLARMAEEELGHFNYLRTQYKSVMEKGDYTFLPQPGPGPSKTGRQSHFQR